MNSTRRVLEFVFVVAVAAVLAGCSSAPVPVDADRTIVARFDNGNGLFPGNAVSVLGMRVGEVVDVAPRGGEIEARLRVDGSIPVPADVHVVTVSDSILTDRHVELTPAYQGGPELGPDVVLGTQRTETPVEFDSLLAMAEKLTTSLGGDGKGNGPIGGLMDLGSAATVDNGADMRAALSELSRALQLGESGGAATKDAITQVVTNLDALSAAAARNDHTLREFGSGVAQLSDLLAEESLGAGDTGTTLNRIIASVTDLLHRNQGAIAASVSNSNTIATSLADYDRNIGEFIDVFPLVTDNAYNAIDQNVGALRATVDINRFLLDGQMTKEVCNLLGLTNLGCNTGNMRDMGPDFGITAILHGLAEGEPK